MQWVAGGERWGIWKFTMFAGWEGRLYQPAWPTKVDYTFTTNPQQGGLGLEHIQNPGIRYI